MSNTPSAEVISPKLQEFLATPDIERTAKNIAGLLSTTFKYERLFTFADLDQETTDEGRVLIGRLLQLSSEDIGLKTPYLGYEEVTGENDLVRIKRFVYFGNQQFPNVAFVPKDAHHAFEEMNEAMNRDGSGNIIIKSGYRAPAYQTLLLIRDLLKSGFGPEVFKYTNLPGYSEHGLLTNTAVDIDDSKRHAVGYKPQDFATTTEYAWLVENAGAFMFNLSYPENNPKGVGFEPWHWQFTGSAASNITS